VLCGGHLFFLLDGLFSYEGGVTNTVYEQFHAQRRATLPMTPASA